jgi:protein-disulfide isomerase
VPAFDRKPVPSVSTRNRKKEFFMNRQIVRTLSVLLGATAMAAALFASPASALTMDEVANRNDPSAGNPKGDVTIVDFSDYNCPFCKTSAAALEKLVKNDGGIRLVYKDLPILTEASVYGARMALAAKYQGKYDAVHAALMGIPGPRIPQSRMLEAIKASGVDMVRLEADLKAHEGDIADQLKGNMEQAEALGLQGTPAFLVGPYLVPSALDYDGFMRVVADARAKIKG